MKHTRVVIVGGGLAGLYAAYTLEQRGIPYQLIEAKPRLGGRILGAENVSSKGHAFDLGPAWVFPHHTKLQALAEELEVSLFQHYALGDVLYQMTEHQAPRRIEGAGELNLFKIKGGCQALINALLDKLTPQNIFVNQALTQIERDKNVWHLTASHNGKVQHFTADELILAMPPRIVAQYVSDKPWISKRLHRDLQHCPTWMAGQAKCVVSYAHPFWREQGLSGQIFSQVGPMVEIHDASTDIHQNFGLFGFIGWPAAARRKLTAEQLQDACVAQLIACFGQQAKEFTGCEVKDWAADMWISIDRDRSEASRHPDFLIQDHCRELADLNLHLVGSEFAMTDPGYLEGAVDAVDRSATRLKY